LETKGKIEENIRVRKNNGNQLGSQKGEEAIAHWIKKEAEE
jgi:hypothetical protein